MRQRSPRDRRGQDGAGDGGGGPLETHDRQALLAIRSGGGVTDSEGGADLVAPLSLTAVRAYRDLDALDVAMGGDGREYRRHGNESVALLERLLGALEQPGEAAPAAGSQPLARATASGQAAILLLLAAAAMAGRRRVVLVRPCYGATEALLTGPLGAMGMSTTLVDLPPPPAEADAGQLVAAACGAGGGGVAAVVVESVTNPLITVVDVPAVVAAAHAHGAACIVDSTFTTPFLLRPLALGADAVMHSLTKHLGGHSDVLGGVAVVAGGSSLADWFDACSRSLGAVLSPFDAWLVLRGLRTAPLRVERGTASAATLATALAGHPALQAVHHPAVRGGADAALARRLLPRGVAPMLGLEVHGGRAGAAEMIRALGTIRLAPSLGDVSTTVSHPASTSHAALGPAARELLGIGDGLLRVSIGIEPAAVLVAEVGEALGRVAGT